MKRESEAVMAGLGKMGGKGGRSKVEIQSDTRKEADLQGKEEMKHPDVEKPRQHQQEKERDGK